MSLPSRRCCLRQSSRCFLVCTRWALTFISSFVSFIICCYSTTALSTLQGWHELGSEGLRFGLHCTRWTVKASIFQTRPSTLRGYCWGHHLRTLTEGQCRQRPSKHRERRWRNQGQDASVSRSRVCHRPKAVG